MTASATPVPDAVSRRSTLTGSIIRTARPRQWSKNVLVLAAPAAAGVLTHRDAALRAGGALLVFTLAASATYFFNDVVDREADRLHPRKRARPVAAGTLPVPVAVAVGAGLAGTALAGSVVLSWKLALVVALYLAVQVAYASGLKRMPVYDLACVATGFVLRGIAGAVAVPVPVSEWFVIVTMFASLLVVTGKRVAEQAELGGSAAEHRATLGLCTPAFYRSVVAVSASGAILGYCLWAFALQTALRHHHDPVWYQLSIVPVLLVLLRYTFLVESGRGSSPEELMFEDHSLVVLGVAWLALFGLGVYAS